MSHRVSLGRLGILGNSAYREAPQLTYIRARDLAECDGVDVMRGPPDPRAPDSPAGPHDTGRMPSFPTGVQPALATIHQCLFVSSIAISPMRGRGGVRRPMHMTACLRALV